jgi:hypothetical protein
MSSNFKSWTLESWNLCLVEGYLRRPTDDGLFPPLEAIQISRPLFARATGLDAFTGDFDLILSTFCSKIQEHSAGREFDQDAFQLARGWTPEDDAIPPFWAHLVFTCYIAATSESTVADFRARTKHLLQTTRSQPFSLLPHLWEAARTWSKHQNDRFGNCRRIKLTKGPFVRIGYSLRFAFPSLKDNQKLTTLLHDANLLRFEPPIKPVIQLLDRNRSLFSDALQNAFNNFRSSFESGSPVSSTDRFWAAVRETSLYGEAGHSPKLQAKWTALLCEDVGALFTCYIVSASEFKALPWEAEHSEFEELDFATVTLDRPDSEGAIAATEALLEASTELPAASDLISAAEAGVLTFQYNSPGIYSFSSRFPSDGPICLLAKGSIVRVLADHFHVKPIESFHQGWFVISGITPKALEAAHSLFPKRLRSSVLERTAPPVRISVRGGFWADTGSSVYLGLPHVLPSFHVEEATKVTAAVEGGQRIALIASSALGDWHLPKIKFDGRLTIEAFRNGQKLSSCSVVLRPDYYGSAYCLAPNRSGDWWLESASGSFVSALEDPKPTGEGEIFDFDHYQLPRLDTIAGPTTRATENLTNELMSAAASVFSHQRGISVSDMLALFERVLGIKTREAWKVLRIWQDSSTVYRAWLRRWRGTRLFGISPHLAIFRMNGKYQAATRGLFYPSLLKRLTSECEARGLRITGPLIYGFGRPPLMLLESSDILDLEKIAAIVDVGSVKLPSPSAAFLTLDPVVLEGEVQAPLKSSRARVNRVAESMVSGQPCVLDHYRWPNQLDRYVLRVGGVTRQFFSQCAAFVAAHRLGVLSIFEIVDNSIVRMTQFGSALPSAAAAYGYLLAARPIKENTDSDVIYDFHCEKLCKAVLASIFPSRREKETASLQQWITFLCQTPQQGAYIPFTLVPGSKLIRSYCPELATILARKGLPLFLLPWTVKLVLQLEAPR